MPAGRPSKYNPSFCERVIELGREGKSPEQISADIDVDRATMARWAEAHPEFRTAITRAKELEHSWWEDVGCRALFADKFQQQVWAKSMQARFREKYTEQQVTTLQGPNGGPINTKIEFSISLVPVPPRDDIV